MYPKSRTIMIDGCRRNLFGKNVAFEVKRFYGRGVLQENERVSGLV